MKKVLVFVIINLLFVVLSMADMLIGRCSFYGEMPPRSMSFGTTLVYYHEMSSSSISRGGVEYKQCSGDVWVIYRSASDVKRIQFQTSNGTVQVCYDF